MTINRTHIITGALLVLLGLLAGYVLFGRESTEGEAGDLAQDTEHQLDQDVDGDDEIWTCSMHPSVRADGPGQCPICGMDLIPASEMEQEDSDYAMTMTAAAAELAQVQTSTVRRDAPTREIRLPGRVEVDERRITGVTAQFPGRIEELKVNFTGSTIQQGQPMAAVYSPELVSAQRELIEAVRHEERNPRLAASAREKLRQWQITEEQIRQIEESGEVRTRFDVLAPASGVVLSRNVSRQEHVEEGAVLFEVAPMDQLWLILEAYEEDLPWLQEGASIEFTTRADPGATHEAEITYIDPVVDPQKRTVRVRADVVNGEGALKPEMLVRGTVRGSGADDQLMIPASAVLWTGPRSIVYVQDTGSEVPRFEAREVTLGSRAEDYYVIEDGLEEGEEVVTHGAFKIDSEFQLADRLSMMNREPGSGARPAHDHGDQDDSPMEELEERDELPTPETSYHDDVPDAFREQLTSVVEAYLDVKDALATSDEEAARAHLSAMKGALEAVDMTLLEGDAHDAWMQDLNALESHLEHADHLQDIDELRGDFQTLSQVLTYSVQQFGVEDVIYHQYCPMAFDEEGGYWLSDREEIENPYIPEEMPDCGEVIERTAS